MQEDTLRPGIDVDAATFGERLLIGANNLAWCFDCDTSTIHRWAKDGIMPAPLTVGGSKRWDVQSIREWIDGGCEPVGLK